MYFILHEKSSFKAAVPNHQAAEKEFIIFF